MNCKFERDYDGKAWNSLLRSDKVELEEERGLMIGEYFARYKVYFTTVSSNEKSDLKRGGKRRESRGKKRKVRREKSRSSFADCEDGAVPTEGCVISLQFYPFPSNSAAAVLLILFYQT